LTFYLCRLLARSHIIALPTSAPILVGEHRRVFALCLSGATRDAQPMTNKFAQVLLPAEKSRRPNQHIIYVSEAGGILNGCLFQVSWRGKISFENKESICDFNF